MKWTVHPAKRDRTRTFLSAVLIAAFLVLVAVFYGLFWGIFGFVVLLVSVHSYFFPTSYEVTNDEVVIKNIFMTQKRKLVEFRRIYIGKNGVLLSPFHRKTVLNQFRGVFLLLPEKRDEVLAFLKERVEKDESHSGGNGGRD